LGGDKECVENCECLDASWEERQNEVCISVGDCGEKPNYLGYKRVLRVKN